MTLPAHLFLASDGALRADYARHFVNINTAARFKSSLRAGPHAWPGGYPLYFLCADGGSLCFDCARAQAREIIAAHRLGRYSRSGWRVIACDINYEDTELLCEQCNKRIEAAYE
jgi:hypothetical protein